MALGTEPDPSLPAVVNVVGGAPPAEQAVIGLLVLASPDPQRYYEGMGTTIIERMGDLASAALSHLR
jgi:uncharacterized protein YigA (DUF484 family)